MIVGVRNFSAGETLRDRVDQGEPRLLKLLSGYDPTTGHLVPDSLPTRVSDAKLTGTMLPQIPFPYKDADGTRIIVRDADEKTRLMSTAGAWGSAGDVIDILADAAPFRLGPLVVMPAGYLAGQKGGADAKVMIYEPDSTGTETRPLSFKGPLNYSTTEKLTVTASTAAGTQLFDIPGSNSWATEVAAGLGELGTEGTDYQGLNFYDDATADTLFFTKDLGATGISLTGQVYLQMDFVFKWRGTDPATAIVKAGEFTNSDQTIFASGLELVLYSDQTADTEITRLTIPLLKTDGSVNRVIWHLGTVSGTIKAIGIRTASYFVAPSGASDYYALWLYSEAFVATWKCKSNFFFPATISNDSPWYDELPADPGTKAADTALPTAAVVLESFPESFKTALPDRPLVRYAYCFRGRSAIGIDEYDVLISNASLPDKTEAAAIAADPWRNYALLITLPENAAEDTVIDDYGDYVTHALIYRQFFSGLEEDTETGDLGVWSDWEYIGYSSIAASMAHDDSKRKTVACTMNQAANTVTCTTHYLQSGNVISFDGTGGGVTAGTEYYVISTANANTFAFSTTLGGSAFDVTGSSDSNNYTKETPVYEVPVDYDVPRYMETNRDYAPSAQFAVVADARVYGFGTKWDNTNSIWKRPTEGVVSNHGDYASFPTSADTADDGEELPKFSPEGVEIKGALVTNDVKVVHTGMGVYELVGRDSATGWEFLRRGGSPLRSARTLADVGGQQFGHGNDYFRAFSGPLAGPISKGIIDSALIDFDYAHGWVPSKNRYVGFCKYADPDAAVEWCLMIYDLGTKSWRRTHSSAYELAGICVEPSSGTVYGLTHDGDIINVFGGTDNYGDTEGVYTVETQFLRIAPTNEERHISYGLLEVVTDQTSIDLEVDYEVQGLDDTTQSITGDLTVTSGQTKYGEGDLNLNLDGDAVSIKVVYRGTTPPEIYFVGVNVDDAVTG